MNNSDLQNMIEKYRKELLKYAEENGGFVKNEAMQMPESEAVVSVLNAPDDNVTREADITELEGTNPESFDSGRNEPTYRDVNEFRNRNRGQGKLKVQVFSGREAFPVVNARVSVMKEFDNGPFAFFDELTDTSGIVDNMPLTTVISENVRENNSFLPYSTYSIRVTHPYYITTVYSNVPVFNGITSIQPVNMIPKTGTPMDDNDIVYVEREPVDL